MKESKVINRKRAKREQRGLISEFAFEREQQRDEARVLRPRARGLCYGNLDKDARFLDGRSVLAYGRGDLGAGRPLPWFSRIDRELVFRELSGIDSTVTGFDPNRKRSSKKKTSPQLSSGNPCTNEKIVPKEEFEVEQEEKEAYWDALCGSITPLPEVFYPTRPATQLDPTFRAGPLPPILRPFGSFTEFRAGLCFESRQLNVAALQNFLGVLILSYELVMDLSPDDFEGLWSTRKISIDYSYRTKRHMSIIQGPTLNAKGWFKLFFYVRIDGASVEENCLPLFCGKWNFYRAISILPAIPRDLFAKRDLLRNGPFFWDSFTLDRIRNAVALYRSRGISRPLRASNMDEPHPDAVPDQKVRPRKDKGIALEDRNFVSEDLLLPGWNPGFTPGDGSGTSEALLLDDFFANLPPGFTTPASLDEASRREVVAEGSRLINEV
ncbi:hypothetical protein F2Q68_00004405 [Brassica cretica]|uniref:Uncharacterized protein n=1 Tax=Brassica cretica TaxID=69181 RepID=A0A8S9J8G5_BRACR|nr:hypothetical protein F2Q68_00004405 [Brassica cretica]